jgi:hypothetical protein
MDKCRPHIHTVANPALTASEKTTAPASETMVETSSMVGSAAVKPTAHMTHMTAATVEGCK